MGMRPPARALRCMLDWHTAALAEYDRHALSIRMHPSHAAAVSLHSAVYCVSRVAVGLRCILIIGAGGQSLTAARRTYLGLGARDAREEGRLACVG
jgi:hypothetical protein